jgi:hypothetical protein
MSRQPQRTMSGPSAWECRLTPSPAQLRQDDPLILTVTLSFRDGIGDISSDQHREFYSDCFIYEYDSDSAEISRLLQRHVDVRSNQVILPNTSSVPVGDHGIAVTVKPVPDFAMLVADRLQGLPGGSDEKLQNFPDITASTTITVSARPPILQAQVTLQRSASARTNDQALWAAIRNRTSAVGFDRYERFISRLFRENPKLVNRLQHEAELTDTGVSAFVDPPLSIYGPHAYNVLKLATQVFLTMEAGVFISHDEAMFDLEHERIRQGDPNVSIHSLTNRLKHYLSAEAGPGVLPYLNRIVRAFLAIDREEIAQKRDEALPFFDNILVHRLTKPSLIELIWSYWHEEGMLVQTMNAVAWRFQNRRSGPNDPLGELEFDALRPLNNVIWGYIQDEHNRLSVPRRASEYRHHYGLTLLGKAVQDLEPADSRTRFIEAFHNLLYRADRFYREDRDTTMIADAFPLLNALKEVHLILAEGMHNQYGDLTWTARSEMLIMQWMLARPEMREFLRGRYAVPYQETWMGAVDSMKRLQGWTDTSITHFNELAVTGERILLSIRLGDWSDIHNIEEQAKNWARNSKPEIQRYMACYQTTTGCDLSAETTDVNDARRRFLQPSTLLQGRLAARKTPAVIGSGRRPLLAADQRPVLETPPPARLARLAKSSGDK